MAHTIMFDFLSDPVGGLLTSARAFLSRVRRFDPDSRIVVLEVNGSLSGSLENPAEFEWVNVTRPGGLSGWRRMLWQNVQLPALIAQHDASLYISLSHYLPWTLPQKVKTIVGVSNLAPFSKEAYAAETSYKKKLRLHILKRSIIGACRRADRVIALSEACSGELVMRGISPEKISVIPNGVSLPAASNEDFRVSGEFILCVSHFYRYKNYERLLHAYASLSEALKERHALVLVGAPCDPTYFKNMEELVSVLKIKDRVRMIPGVYGSELISLYRSCALFVFPSLIENSPITLLEAMINGAAVAASNVPAMREFGGDAVAYFDPLSERDLARAIELLLTNKAVHEKLKVMGSRRARLYSWEGFTEKLVTLYKGLA